MMINNDELLTAEPVLRAAFFAAGAHKAIGHKRKYTEKGYFEDHVMNVARSVLMVDWATEDMVVTAYLHDVLEDTEVTLHDLRMYFGPTIAGYVKILTNPEDRGDLSRIEAAKENAERIASSIAPKELATVKCADILDNVSDVAKRDPKFAKVYLREKETMVEILSMADPNLRSFCFHAIAIAKLELDGYSEEEATRKYWEKLNES